MNQLRLVPSGLVSVKALATQYGISKSTLYELIKSDPTIPYRNVGLKKKLMIDAIQFEQWLEARTDRQKDDRLGLTTAYGLLERRRQ